MSHELLHQIWTFWLQIVNATMRHLRLYYSEVIASLEVLRSNYKVEVMLDFKVTVVEDTPQNV